MNYLASGLDQGFALGSAARQKKLDRQQQDELELKRKQFELDQQARTIAAQKALQDAQLVADATKQFKQQGWQSGENTAERGWKTGERIGTEGFTGMEGDRKRGFDATQAQLDRDAKATLQQRQLDQASEEFKAGNQLKRDQWDQHLPLLGAELGIKAREVDQHYPPDTNAPQGMFGPDAEGRIVIGPDGKRYKVTNGRPVPIQ